MKRNKLILFILAILFIISSCGGGGGGSSSNNSTITPITGPDNSTATGTYEIVSMEYNFITAGYDNYSTDDFDYFFGRMTIDNASDQGDKRKYCIAQ